jgi:hypothetical protein
VLRLLLYRVSRTRGVRQSQTGKTRLRLASFLQYRVSRTGRRPVRNENVAVGEMDLRLGWGSGWSPEATIGRNPLCELSEMFTAERPNLASRTVGHILPPRSLKDG